MSKRLVGFDKAWMPQSFLSTKLPAQPNPTNIGMMWGGLNPYSRPQDQLGPQTGITNPALQNLKNYNTQATAAIGQANKETGFNYMTPMMRPALGAPNQLGAPQAVNPFVRGQTGTGDWVALPAMKAMRNGRVASPEELNYALRNAQLIQGGFGPLEGLLGVGMFGLGLPGGVFSNLIGKLPSGLQTLAKWGGGLKSGVDAVTSKGRSGASTILSMLR